MKTGKVILKPNRINYRFSNKVVQASCLQAKNKQDACSTFVISRVFEKNPAFL